MPSSPGINTVKVSIQDSASGKCWNATNFTTAACPNYISVTRAGSTAASAAANWSYTLPSCSLTCADTHPVLHSFPTRRSSDLTDTAAATVSWSYDTSAPTAAVLSSNGTY